MFAMVDGYVVESGCGLAQSIPWVKVRETTPQVFAMECHKGQSIKGSNVVTMATWKFDNGGWCLPLVVRVARQLLWWACLGPCQHRWLHWLARWTVGSSLRWLTCNVQVTLLANNVTFHVALPGSDQRYVLLRIIGFCEKKIHQCTTVTVLEICSKALHYHKITLISLNPKYKPVIHFPQWKDLIMDTLVKQLINTLWSSGTKVNVIMSNVQSPQWH